ncbi:MAG: hypothetical protein M1839_005359 [Geoglossum umbratile]|nr:MAG: hypothetical protein M1839_005359 [Geoglossum umbratile]
MASQKNYLNALSEQSKNNNTFRSFNITTSCACTKHELLAELNNRGLWVVDVSAEMLDNAKDLPAKGISGSSWRIKVRQSRVAYFRVICPWDIISEGDGEARDLGKPAVVGGKA